MSEYMAYSQQLSGYLVGISQVAAVDLTTRMFREQIGQLIAGVSGKYEGADIMIEVRVRPVGLVKE